MLGRQRPSLELAAGRKLVVQTGMSLEVGRGQSNAFGRQIGRGRHQASAICAQSPVHQTRVANVGEAHDGIKALLQYEKVYGFHYEGKLHDAGDKLGFLKATVEFALKRDDLGPAFRTWLKSFPL